MTARARILRLSRTALAGAFLLFATAYGAICWLTAERLTRPTNHPLMVDPCRLSPDAEPWSVRTRDGLMLRGWRLVAGGPGRRLIVLVHGMWSAWPEMAELGRDLHQRGFDVLLFDLRGHGQSDPARLSLGARERADLRAVMEWAGKAGYDEHRIGWLGYSMGAAALVMEGASNPAIHAAVLDSPYGDLPRLLETQLSRHSGLPGWFNPGILACARWLYGLRIEELVPVEAASRWGDRPMLLIHGEADSTVPVEQARRLGRALGSACTTAFLPGVEHVEAYRDDPGGYVGLIAEFFDRSLAP